MFRPTQLCCLLICVLSCHLGAFANDGAPVEAPVPALAKAETLADAAIKVGTNVIVLTTDGRVQTGVLTRQDKESITIKVKDGNTKAIPRKEIVELREVKKRVAVAAVGGIVVRRADGTSAITGIRKDFDPQDPQERFLVLTPGGPIVVEATIYVDGQPFRVAREDLTARQMKAADTDGDGKATWDEAVANPRFGFGRFSNNIRNKAQLQATLMRYDQNKNGVVEVNEVRLFVGSLGGGPAFSVVDGMSSFARPRVKALLDDNSDGVLSPEEIAAAPKRLKSRDANNNDLLEATETGGHTGRAPYRSVGFVTTTSRTQKNSNAFLLGPTANLTTIFTAIKNKYAGADQAIQREDFRWFSETVTQLDLDKNGALDSGELIGLHLVKPHIAVEVNIGDDEQWPAGIRFSAIAKGLGDLDRFSKEFGDEIVIERPGMKLTLGAPHVTNRFTEGYSRSAKSMLTRYDADKNGYIEKEEIKKVAGANQQYLVSQFDRWDADGDGMVFAKEIEAAYLDQMAPRMTAVMATSMNRGPSFFNALDETGDNRISLREMRIASKRLATFDKNGDGQLGIEEMPVEMDVTFTRGPVYFSNRGRASRVTTRPVRPNISANTPRIPDWFTRMDSNGDGDLTVREFLGGEEKFKEIDTNSDGFIERAEAAAVASK